MPPTIPDSAAPGIAAIVFDKDGTLFDFNESWSAWSSRLLEDLAGGDTALASSLGTAIGYDLSQRRFAPDSIVIAGTPREIATKLLPLLPGFDMARLVARMNVLAAQAPLKAAVPLGPLLRQLKRRGLILGLATNDAEAPARAHLTEAEVLDLFDFVAGSDSGHGGKPEPGMLLAFARTFDLDPGRVVMVGDSLHDLSAGRAAGMRTVGVLTGPARRADLAPLADVVLQDIGGLPAWLEGEAPQTPLETGRESVS
ncbi:phosphatase [Haematobacter massiliensis]|uniref:HAD family hydrolase n=1 Tax=Haematobacter massiliensis TaxID=195105 RepID=UPI000AC828D7|nr:HAD family hydrolase [Haematobacter massiliensis]OWJ70493.1 phosphatase [Haematobacter massiliensis]OWJ87537.1 phosphatase [Haematobacter massiliensis]QBJ24819.1 HAD family hydrolase [Haematobacter massiliensis]